MTTATSIVAHTILGIAESDGGRGLEPMLIALQLVTGGFVVGALIIVVAILMRST
jgi:hypothetical protein